MEGHAVSYEDDDLHGGDSLTDLGFFAVTLAACGILIALVLLFIGVW